MCVFDLLSNDSLLGTEYIRSPLGQSLQHVLHLLVSASRNSPTISLMLILSPSFTIHVYMLHCIHVTLYTHPHILYIYNIWTIVKHIHVCDQYVEWGCQNYKGVVELCHMSTSRPLMTSILRPYRC